MRILAVDDDPIFLGLLTRVLRSAGYEKVKSCISAKAALEMLKDDEHRFDCFLLDIKMPGKDGVALCRDIRALKNYRETPILMITASPDLNHVDGAFKAGATDYIRKPIDGLELGSRIRIAKMMVEQTSRLSDLAAVSQGCRPMPLVEADQGFEGEIAVHGIAGTRAYMGLENELLKLAPGSYNLAIFALKIEAAAQLFVKHGRGIFHRIVTGVGMSISTELDLSRTSFTYAGRGVFGCVRFGRGSLTDLRRIREALCSDQALTVSVGEGGSVAVRLVLASPLASTVWTGRSAAEALKKSVEKADVLASDLLIQQNLDALRLDEPIGPRRHKLSFRHQHQVL